jgi:hypothetical protein
VVEKTDVDNCSTIEPISELGFLSLMHLAKFGDAAAIEELTRRKIEAELNKPDNA